MSSTMMEIKTLSILFVVSENGGEAGEDASILEDEEGRQEEKMDEDDLDLNESKKEKENDTEEGEVSIF